MSWLDAFFSGMGLAPIVVTGGAVPQISITPATESAAGSMSAADKTKLDGLTSPNTDGGPVATIKVKKTVDFATATLIIAGGGRAVALFELTGAVEVSKLVGIVASTIGDDHSLSNFFLLTASSDLALIADSAATEMSGLQPGSAVLAVGTASGASPLPAQVLDATLPTVSEFEQGTPALPPFTLVQQTGTVTKIYYGFTLAAAASGVVDFFCAYTPVGLTDSVTAV